MQKCSASLTKFNHLYYNPQSIYSPNFMKSHSPLLERFCY